MKSAKHKKILAVLAALIVLAGSPAAVFADGSFGEGTAQHNRDIAGDSPFTLDATNSNATGVKNDSADGQGLVPKGKPIPVYGYVGEDAVITDPDSNDPETPPEELDVDINVSVPVKILWAAFESDGGAVTSPNYRIKNNGDANLKVTVVNFASTGTDNNDIDKYLTLNLTGIGSVFSQAELVKPNNDNSAAVYHTSGTTAIP